MILFIDNYDSFTYNLVQFCGSVNPDIKVVRNDEIIVDEIKKLAPSHIILSPGPGYPKDAGICEEVIKEPCRTVSDSRYLPRSSGNMRGLRCNNRPRNKAYARQKERYHC